MFLNYFFWEQADFSADAIEPAEREEVLGALRTVWNGELHGVGLGVA